MQNSQTPIGIEAMMQQEITQQPNGFNSMSTIYENPTQYPNASSFITPSNSSSSTFNNPQEDKISSVVSMLKGTLERKKLNNEREAVDDTTYYSAAQVLGFNHDSFDNQGPFQDGSVVLGADETRALQTIEESLMEGILGPLNQMRTMSREPSQSESSAAAPVVSNGVDIYDDPCISAQAPTVCESSMHQIGRGRSPEDSSRSRGIDHILEIFLARIMSYFDFVFVLTFMFVD